MFACSKDGCPEIVAGRYCDAHKPKPPRSPSSAVTGRRDFREGIRPRVLKRDDYTCQECGHRDPTGRTLQIDHVKPVSRGGPPRELPNLRALCRDCNARKSNRQ